MVPLDGREWRGYAKVMRDITERKQLEDELQRRADDLARADEQKDQFLTMLAHELRNPLSTMMVNLKLLAEDLQDVGTDFDATRRRALLKVDTLRKEAERLQSLFDDFLKLTRPYHLIRKECDLNALLDRLVEFFDPLMKAHKVKVSFRKADRPLVCRIDEKLINQALLNLAINAQEAMPRGGELSITTASEDAWAVLCIVDTGVGIDEKNLGRITRPFYSTKSKGTGLGLSIVKEIADSHKGSITVKSEVGKGSTFTLVLPAIKN